MPDSDSTDNPPEMITVPAEGAELSEIHDFAMTYDGYGSNGDEATGFQNCATVANLAAEKWLERRLLPDTLHDLRTCLFFEARRHHWSSPISVDYEAALVRRIREVAGGEVPLDSNSPAAIHRRRPQWG
jgi:hypothetical protein